jgi:hypothetical protein
MSDESPYTPPASKVSDVASADEQRPKPREVVWAVKLLWIDVLLALPAAYLSFARSESQDGAGVIWVMFTAMLFALAVAVIVNLDRGHHWARIAQLVLFGLFLVMLATVTEVAVPPSPLETLLEYASVVLEAVALYFVFTRPGAEWFARRT